MQIDAAAIQGNMAARVYFMPAKKVSSSAKAMKDSNANRFGEYIRVLLKERGLTYRAASQKVGGLIAHATINKIVNGNQADSTLFLFWIQTGFNPVPT